MVFEFWRSRSEIMFFWPSIIIFSFTFIISGLVLMIINNIGFAGMIIAGTIPLILSLILFISDKKFFSKIAISKEGITWKKFRKKILFISWDGIIKIKTISISPAAKHLALISDKGKIEFEVTKKIYNTIMILCSNANVKMHINNLKEFEYLHINNKV